MANHWAEAGDQVTAITLDTVGSDVYHVDQRVRRIGLDLMSTSRGKVDAVRSNFRRVRALRRVIDETDPDCVVSVTAPMNIVTLMACRRWAGPYPCS